MKLASTLTAVQWFVQVLLEESPHSLAFAIQHWAEGVFDDDPGLPSALQSMSTAMSNVLEQLNLAQSIRGENEGVREYLRNLKEAAYTADDLLSELEYYRLELLVEQQDVLDYNATSNEDQASTSSSACYTADEDQASTSSPSQYPSMEDNKSNLVPRMYENVSRLETITAALSSVLSLLKLVEDFQPNPHDFPVASHRITTSFSSSKQTVIGRDSERDQIIKLLLLPTPTSVSMIPIVGMGGIGKTTLAKMVYNHEEIKKHFERRIWLCVSDNFDVARLTREILEELGVRFDHTTNVNELQELLMKKLKSVRYLLVLDDVWNESEEEKWSSLCAPLRSQEGGSRLLMTTRLNTVVSIAVKNMDMLHQCQLEGLPEEIYLPFFSICAFGDENPRNHLSLEKIGKQIAGRLTGSPLAAKTVGGLLRDYLDEDHWRSVLNSPIWQLPQIHHDIMPALQLSYHHLAPNLQQCFIYCSIFPKDHEFDKNDMVGMWISSGYIRTKSRENKSLEEIGREYFDNLLSRSFIQESDHFDRFLSRSINPESGSIPITRKEYFDNLFSRFIQKSGSISFTGVKYVLHDLLHDLAESVSDNEHLKINPGETKEITSSVRHLYVDTKNLSFLKNCNLRNLRTLVIMHKSDKCYNVLEEVLNGLRSIHVLLMGGVYVKNFPRSIGHLIHLRHLTVDFSNRTRLIDSQWRPYHLQWLFQEAIYIDLSAYTKYLVSLRHCNFKSILDDFRMSGIGKLTCLQELESFSVEKTEGRKLAELKRLNELKGTLRLDSLENVSTKEEALEANLNKKEGIHALELACDNGHTTPQMAEAAFEGLCPPPYIKKLTLNVYLGVESPTWMLTVNCCLSVLQSLTLYNCQNWKVLPPLGQLPLLGYLKIYGANAVEEIGSNFYGSGVAHSFPCLETLEFEDMPEWVVWSGVEKDTDSLFPRLRKLTVVDCPKLKGVPMQCLASVEVLTIVSCDQLEVLTLTSASLQQLDIRGCPQLHSLPPMPASLQELKIVSCPQLHSLPPMPASLQQLEIHVCPQLHSLPPMPASLQSLNILSCPQLHSLPPMPASLQNLVIYECPELPRERYQEGGDDWHKISRVPSIEWY